MSALNKKTTLVWAGLAVSWVVLASVARAQDVSFIAPLTFAAGSQPVSVALGDFNGNGVLDLIVANYPSEGGSMTVLLGTGDGRFQAPRSLSAGASPRSVAVGDFNGDGVLDLVVANYISDTVSVLLGNGDGSFQAPRAFFLGADDYPISVAVGDFNGDGRLDVAVANYGSNDVSVLLGNGDGEFQPRRSFGAGKRPAAVAVADFNGDGWPDLAVVNSHFQNVSVLLGNGDGSFQRARNFTAGRNPQSVAVGDFNGDGWVDLVVEHFISLQGVCFQRIGRCASTLRMTRPVVCRWVARSSSVADRWQC